MSSTTRTPHPIFVVGYMHSGTTMLVRMLERHTAVYGGRGETKFFDFLPVTKRHFDLERADGLDRLVRFAAYVFINGCPHNLSAPVLDELQADVPDGIGERLRQDLGGVRDHGAVFRAVGDYLARREGRTRWVEKTPTHVFHLDVIRRGIPDALFVEIVRDPRDVLASKKTRRQTVWSTERYRPEMRSKKHLEKGYDPVWDTLAWKAAVSAGRRARRASPSTIILVQYEELVSDASAELQRVCEFVGLPFEADMLDVEVENPAEWRQTRSRGVVTGSLGRFRTVLSPSEVYVCQTLTTRERADLGYEPVAVAVRHKVTALVHGGRAGVDLVVRLARKWRLGERRYLRAVLHGYIRRLRLLWSDPEWKER